MIVFIECLTLALLFTVMVFNISKNSIATLYNYPSKVRERVMSFNIYKNKIAAKIIVAISIVILVSLTFRYFVVL